VGGTRGRGGGELLWELEGLEVSLKPRCVQEL
jgi:hypothetical protein